jgi:hypothetical protein
VKLLLQRQLGCFRAEQTDEMRPEVVTPPFQSVIVLSSSFAVTPPWVDSEYLLIRLT